MDTIKVDIDIENNSISVFNNGAGIPIVIHEKEKVYIPQMIFGQLLSGGNFDDTEKRVVGGRNGYGAKLTNIYSTEFSVETADKSSGQVYKQTWKNNMEYVANRHFPNAKRVWSIQRSLSSPTCNDSACPASTTTRSRCFLSGFTI